ncbi:alkylation response protein AidB-like acyl-CoA dehydrogenase [Micromonospora palomenae]|uniref:Alkylation response protein AidB-like acyl-CoA dehydrogenase n=1 Tax=Micromonospora palomenae TaxID=1461247 RepID=A0A561WYL9_9ACTN|nr:acyl-CoA dehydrogenase family protein [Micromonospora palomenae]TWG28954.1 alkylation response protein AidB-like acyl-CoA dehydrogenase [Micromonospora palomenae]
MTAITTDRPSTADAVPSSDELVARAANLVPLLRSNAETTEKQRRVVEENIEAIKAADLYRISVPSRLGGLQTDVTTSLRVSVELARGDGSTAWATTLMNVSAWMIGLFPDRAQQEVWGEDPTARVCGVLAPTATSRKVEGGLVVTGRWGFASGCLHSQWAGLGIPIVNEAGEPIDQGMALIPMSDLSVEDTWYVAGMRGTGSNTLVADEVFVPDHRILSVTRAIGGDYPTEHTGEALYRSALVPVLALVLVAPQVGLAKQALEIVQASLAKGRGISYTFYDKSSLAPTTQLQVAQAAQLIDTAELHMLRAAGDIDRAAASGEYLDFDTRARVRADVGTVARSCREAVDLLLNVHGAGSFAEANPLQRVWRDLETGSRHGVVNPEIGFELYGRALLGVQEQITALI